MFKKTTKQVHDLLYINYLHKLQLQDHIILMVITEIVQLEFLIMHS